MEKIPQGYFVRGDAQIETAAQFRQRVFGVLLFRVERINFSTK